MTPATLDSVSHLLGVCGVAERSRATEPRNLCDGQLASTTQKYLPVPARLLPSAPSSGALSPLPTPLLAGLLAYGSPSSAAGQVKLIRADQGC